MTIRSSGRDPFTLNTIEGTTRNPRTRHDSFVEAGCANLGGGPDGVGQVALDD